ncbi:MAG: hypothetical protein DMF51_00395 [Acidobacteria bacterium]|nr:MAG: hypothetical protein DMF51_00395 [Acidobacteriota bacterium]
MKDLRGVAVLGLAVALLLPGRAAGQKMPSLGPSPGTRVGNLAQDFTLKDLDNRSYSLKEMRGKRVVHVVFWATWCVPCLEEVPALRATYDKYRERGLQVLGIAVNESQTLDGVRAAARDMKINYPILWDDGGSLMERYRVSYIPQNFLIGKDGVIRYAGTSLPANYDTLVESLLKEDAAVASSTRRH